MTTTPFGERLKREREMRGVSIEEISSHTRISVRFLEALENERWHDLPGGIFNRGFIRAVAHFLGLNEESLMAEYALATNDRPAVTTLARVPPPPSRWWIAAAITGALLLIIFGGWLAYRHFAPRLRARWHPAAKSSAAQPKAEQATPSPLRLNGQFHAPLGPRGHSSRVPLALQDPQTPQGGRD